MDSEIHKKLKEKFLKTDTIPIRGYKGKFSMSSVFSEDKTLKNGNKDFSISMPDDENSVISREKIFEMMERVSKQSTISIPIISYEEAMMCLSAAKFDTGDKELDRHLERTRKSLVGKYFHDKFNKIG